LRFTDSHVKNASANANGARQFTLRKFCITRVNQASITKRLSNALRRWITLIRYPASPKSIVGFSSNPDDRVAWGGSWIVQVIVATDDYMVWTRVQTLNINNNLLLFSNEWHIRISIILHYLLLECLHLIRKTAETYSDYIIFYCLINTIY